MTEKIERQLPTGIGGEKLKEGRDTLPAVEVANEVSWVNNKMNLPFDLKVGEPSRLGMFLTPDPKTGEKVFNLEVSGSHTRSGILGRVIFSDKEGRLYRDIDLKGVGFIRKDYNRISVEPTTKAEKGEIGGSSEFSLFKGSRGIANQELINRDVKFSEKFLKAGIRTHRVIAVIDLKEIVDANGNKITIDQAKEQNLIAKDDEPVVEVRAYGTRSRIWDVRSSSENTIKILSDAKDMVATELGIKPEEFSFKSYFDWFVKTTARNLARMHYNHWVSGYLTQHNITLDARFMDLDSVETLAKIENAQGTFESKNPEDDLDQVNEDLDMLRETILGVDWDNRDSYNFKKTRDVFKNFYDDELKRLKTEKVPKIRH